MSEEFSKDFDPDNPFEPDESQISILENLPDDIEYDTDVFSQFEIVDSPELTIKSVFESENLDKIVKDYTSSKQIYNELNNKHKQNKKDL
jgi:hypothetical protein